MDDVQTAPGSSRALDNETQELLRELKPMLERNGIVQNRHGVFRLRFRQHDKENERVVHRSVTLGRDVAEAEAVAEVVDRWKAEFEAQEAARRALCAQEVRAERQSALEKHLMLRLLGRANGGGRDFQRELVQEFMAKMAAGPLEGLQFAMAVEGRYPNPAGRPRKARLW